MKKFKRRTIAIVSMMTMLFSISVYGATDTMTAVSVDRSVESKWDLSLTETYMGNNMYTYTATEKQDDYRRFDYVKLKVVAFGMSSENAVNEVEGENLFEFSATVAAYPGIEPTGTAACDYYVEDSYLGTATKRVTHD